MDERPDQHLPPRQGRDATVAAERLVQLADRQFHAIAILLYQRRIPASTSNEGGRFSIPMLPNGWTNFTVSIEKDGLRSQEWLLRLTGEPIDRILQ